MRDTKHATRIALASCAILAATTLIGFSGCDISLNVREDGDIYGYYRSPSDCAVDYLSLGGFPEGRIVENSNYRVKEGTYICEYVLYDGFRYWPGNAYGTGGFDSSWYWKATYTVSANPGTAAGKGETKHFGLYLSKFYGLLPDYGDVYVQTAPYYSEKSPNGLSSSDYASDSVSITNEIAKR